MQQQILITGGTGFFGRALIRYLIDHVESSTCKVFIISRNPQQFVHQYPDLAGLDIVNMIEGDIEVRSSLPWKKKFTHILHAATDSTFGPKLTPLDRYNQICEGTRNILDLAVATGAQRFLLTSSGGIYGPQPEDLNAIPETWQGSPALDLASSAYSQGKRAAEHLCALYRDAYGIETVIARCFSFVGVDLPLDVHFAIGNFIHDAIGSPTIKVNGDGKAERTYLDQRDLAHWLWTLLHTGLNGEAYNIGSDRVVSIAELADLVRNLLAPEKAVQILGAPELDNKQRSRYVPDISKVRRHHGLIPSFQLEQGIIDTYNAYRSISSAD